MKTILTLFVFSLALFAVTSVTLAQPANTMLADQAREENAYTVDCIAAAAAK